LRQKKNILSKMVEPLKTGDLLAKEGLIRPEDIDKVLLLQKKEQDSSSLKTKRLFGMILCDLNLITPRDNYYVLHKYNKLQSLQSLLVSKKILSKEMVERTEKDVKQQDIPFISSLLEQGLVSTGQMQTILFDLFHIPFKSISDFTFNKEDANLMIQVMDKQKSLENKCIPLGLKDNTLVFGITDPENILFLQKLNDLFPQYRFKSVFISFSWFSKFYEKIYKTSREKEHRKKTTPTDKILDLSLLLNFKTSIQDPEQENDSIQTLYERYELLRQLIGNPKRANLENEFAEFVIETHKKITREYKNQIIKFSLKKEKRDVKIIAFPQI
jgi:MshEN domain